MNIMKPHAYRSPTGYEGAAPPQSEGDIGVSGFEHGSVRLLLESASRNQVPARVGAEPTTSA